MSEEAGDRDGRKDREARRSEREVRIRERSEDRKAPMKNLEDLFKKTSSSPAIYWRPLTEQDIQRRIELRNKVRRFSVSLLSCRKLLQHEKAWSDPALTKQFCF